MVKLSKWTQMKIRGFFAVDHPQCDVWKQKTQILIAHQKAGIDRTQKSFLAAKKGSTRV